MRTIRKRLAPTALAAALAAAAGGAQAEISGNVTLATDYRFRGVSQTDRQMALQGGLDWSHASGFYVGTWASNVDSNFFSGTSTDPQLEWDLYVGYSGEIGGLGYDVGIIRYVYPGYDDANTTEIHVGVSYGVSDSVSVGADLYYSPELGFVGSNDSAWYFVVSGEVALPQGFTLSASVGRSFGEAFDGADSDPDTDYDAYTDWSIGISKDVAGVTLGLSWIGTSSDAESTTLGFGGVAEDTFVFSVSKSM